MMNSGDSDSERKDQLKSSNPRPIRWWPALVILLVAAGALIWLRFLQDVINHQNQNLQTAQVVVFTSVALLLWCLFFSRLRWSIWADLSDRASVPDSRRHWRFVAGPGMALEKTAQFHPGNQATSGHWNRPPATGGTGCSNRKRLLSISRASSQLHRVRAATGA